MAEPIIIVTTDSEGDTDTDESDLDSPLLSSSQHRQAHPPQNAMKQTTLSSVWKPLRKWPEEEREAQRQRQQERNAVTRMEAHRREEQPDDGDLARISHPGMEGWRKKRNGKNGGTKQEKPKRTNWFHPILWTLIDKVMRKAAWSSEKAVSIQQCENGKIFKHIHRGTIIKWKEQGKNAWLEKTLQNVKNQHSLSGSGHSGILAKYPNIVEEIKKTLKDLRLSGIPVNVVMGRSIMLTIINQHEPSLLTGEFRCSERFVQDFFQLVMNWSLRQATRAAAHLPIDAPDSCERTFFCLVYAMKWENIPPSLVVNVDQMGMFVLPSSSRTYHDKGAKQVDAVAKDEKRAYSLLVASSTDRNILPFQQVWGGKSSHSLPSAAAFGISEAIELKFHFAFAASESNPRSHFSTLKTMKEWVEAVLVPYHLEIIERDNLRSIFQPADVGLQRPIKHILKQALFKYLSNVHRQQIISGLKPEDIQITTSLPKLRDASVAGLVEAYKFLKSLDGHDLIKMWCLSAECLTSQAAQDALSEYLIHDSTLYNKIRARLGTVQGFQDSSPSNENDIDHLTHDDTDIPLHAVIQATVGCALGADANHASFVITHFTQGEDGTGGLIAAGLDEDLWQFDDSGERWLIEGNSS
ncbi:hypothetical protein BDQ17DRAFT_1336533 [Cyathus striatus]|nr:hypothetical protein BDQ17DRAFT_1336533 [Cyathus striatus]